MGDDDDDDDGDDDDDDYDDDDDDDDGHHHHHGDHHHHHHHHHHFIMFRLHVLFSWRLSCFRSVQHLLLGGHTSVIIIGGSISWLDSRNGLIFSFLARFELVLCISIIIFLCTANVSHQKNWLLGNK